MKEEPSKWDNMSFTDCREVEPVMVRNIRKTSTVIQPQMYICNTYLQFNGMFKCCNLNMSGYSCKSEEEKSTHAGCCPE